MIDVARIDYWATTGTGTFHRASVPAKLLFLAFAVASAVAAKRPLPLAAGYGALLLIAALSGLPWLRIAFLSLYAALFASVYAVSLRGGAGQFAAMVLKAVTPAYAVSMLIVTTPYPRIFAFLSAFLPEILAAGLFMTYRTLFILLDLMDSFGAAIRLRGGFSPGRLSRNSSNISRGIAMLLVQAVERATRLYAVMAVRGYSGSMAETAVGRFRRDDWLPLLAGLTVLTLVVAWR